MHPEKTRNPVAPGRLAAALAAALLIALAPGLAACSAAPAADGAGQPAAEQQAWVSVTQRVGEAERAVEVAEGATVLDVLKASGVPYESSDGPYGAYVTSVDGKAADGGSGWTYTVNGEQPTVGCGEYKVADGDTVAWEFVSYE